MSLGDAARAVDLLLGDYKTQVLELEANVAQTREAIRQFRAEELPQGSRLLDLLIQFGLLDQWLETNDAMWRALERADSLGASSIQKFSAQVVKKFVHRGPFGEEWVNMQFRQLYAAIETKAHHTFTISGAAQRFENVRGVDAFEDDPVDDAAEAIEDFATMMICSLGQTDELLRSTGFRPPLPAGPYREASPELAIPPSFSASTNSEILLDE